MRPAGKEPGRGAVRRSRRGGRRQDRRHATSRRRQCAGDELDGVHREDADVLAVVRVEVRSMVSDCRLHEHADENPVEARPDAWKAMIRPSARNIGAPQAQRPPAGLRGGAGVRRRCPRGAERVRHQPERARHAHEYPRAHQAARCPGERTGTGNVGPARNPPVRSDVAARRSHRRLPSPPPRAVTAAMQTLAVAQVVAAARFAARGKRRSPDVAAFLLDGERACAALLGELRAGEWRAFLRAEAIRAT